MIILAFVGGITIFRQSRAIWDMPSQNAVSINTTLNTYTFIEPAFLIIIVVVIAFTMMITKRAF